MPPLALALQILTLSAAPDRVTGGDVLVRIEPADSRPLTVQLNGRDITSSFRPAGAALLGLVTGLRPGANLLTAGGQQLPLTNFPAAGPVFSGPHQQPFVCESASFALPGGDLLGPPLDTDCTTRTVVTYLYRPTPHGPLKPLPSLSTLPADVARTTTTRGPTGPSTVPLETRTRNRANSPTAILHDPTADPAPT
ncbi:MAG: DUF6351 family protein, partial [Acidobacteriota bacterium]